MLVGSETNNIQNFIVCGPILDHQLSSRYDLQVNSEINLAVSQSFLNTRLALRLSIQAFVVVDNIDVSSS